MSAVTFMKRQNIVEQKKIAKAQRKLSVQQKSDQIPVTISCSDNSDPLEISQVTDSIDPLSTITEYLANICRFTALTDEFDYSTLKPSTPAYMVETSTFVQVGIKNLRYQSRFAETIFSATSSTTLARLVPHDHHKDTVHSPPMTWVPRKDKSNASSYLKLKYAGAQRQKR